MSGPPGAPNPVAAAPGSVKKRKMPWQTADETLVEKTSRSVLLQYLTQRPEHLGQLLRQLPQSERAKAYKSIHPSELVNNLTATYKREIKNEDAIVILNYHDSAVDMDYARLAFSDLPDDFQEVLQAWYETWWNDNDTPQKRQNNIERDGSAILELGNECDELHDSIEKHVGYLQTDAEQGGEEDDDDDVFNYDEKVETVTEDIKQWISGCEWVKIEPTERRQVMTYNALITIRFQGDE